jgi:hypothetical protein
MAMMRSAAGPQHVGGGEEARYQVLGWNLRCRDQRAVGERDPQQGLRAARADVLEMRAAALTAGMADLAGIVGSEERADDELAALDILHRVSNLLDDAAVLVAHRHRLCGSIDAPVGPEIRPAHTGGGHTQDHIGRRENLRLFALHITNVARAVENSSFHDRSPVRLEGSMDGVAAVHDERMADDVGGAGAA